MNKTMSILYRGLTEEEIMERLDSHNVNKICMEVWSGQYKHYYLW